MTDDMRDLLNRVAAGELSPEEAEAQLSAAGVGTPASETPAPEPAAAAINANKAWLAAANAAGTCAGKMISPQSIAIAVGAISLTGKDNEILQAIMKVYVPYIILLGAIVYFGQVLVG